MADEICLLHSLAAVAQEDAKCLILGSMPGRLSLEKQQYYAHPRNAFWQIMAALYGFNAQLSYPEKLTALIQHKIALWDVIQSCERLGSLDSNIKPDSVIPNDLSGFFRRHRQIQQIFFNGSQAEQQYRKNIYPLLPPPLQQLACLRLPSTSPAMASLTWEEKLTAWQPLKLVTL
jgi:double-stranded uracil-DNA glycosylase